MFAAARRGDATALRSALDTGADVTALDGAGWSALHWAAMATGEDPFAATETLAVLLAHGAPVEQPSRDGRTALYLAAEFSSAPEPVALLLAHGADPDVRDGHGNHITVNAAAEEVIGLIEVAMGGGPARTPVPGSAEASTTDPQPTGSWSKSDWRGAKKRIARVFAELNTDGFIALAGTGTTQSDAFSDCRDEFHARGADLDALVGFCFTTRQDTRRARATGQLHLAFWGAPEGTAAEMERAGTRVVAAFRRAGFAVLWDGSGASRPCIDLTR
ncbi:ankyrin repeat domain-containing protein [Streptomyces sp. NBC_00690]|uniref:ankyrin repeat domain-containing protein n=1 Tax=Streptomyces sp. NBC_00690 TaxID=2975808 RepID=UPI002E2AC5F5|nr:ankyrin repeat domain-containing protein [Streptomyces sp. NBC_00690]